MIAAASHLLAAGLAPPVCIAVHPSFAADAYEALRAAGVERNVSCNTIAHSSNGIDVSEMVAYSIGKTVVLQRQ